MAFGLQFVVGSQLYSVVVTVCVPQLCTNMPQVLYTGTAASVQWLPTAGMYFGTYGQHGWEIVRVFYVGESGVHVEKLTVG
jgi:hypothetical protein